MLLLLITTQAVPQQVEDYVPNQSKRPTEINRRITSPEPHRFNELTFKRPNNSFEENSRY